MKYKLTSTIFLNHCFDKRRFNSFLHWFFRKNHHGHYRLLKFLEKIKLLGFHSATAAGFSISMDDLKIPESKSLVLLNAENKIFETDFHLMAGNLTTIERYQSILEIWNRTSEKLKYEVLKSFKFSDFANPVYFMAFSGARGNISQIRQLVGMRGLMTDPQGQIIDFPIRSNFREGLTLTEYLISCSGARKGIVDTALRTAASGYLTRRLVDVAHQVIISQIDCHDSRGIGVEDLYDNQQKKILSLKQRLIGRILAETIVCPSKSVVIGSKNQEISQKISHKICEIRQKVQIRSPLTCKSAQFVCQFCYGWNLAEGQLVSIGEAVGILAAQSIGEPGTQLTMRTFHTGGVFTGTLLDQTYAPFSGRVHYLFSCIGLLVRTQQGKIAYLTKNNGILEINKQQKKIQFGFQNGSLLYVKEGEDISQTQLMAELPFFEEENALENEHKILSLNSGEMHFENFVLFEKTKFDFFERQTQNYAQGINEFWILSAQFFSFWGEKRNSFFRGLDLADKSIPSTQVLLNLRPHPNQNFVSDSIFFKNRGYFSKPRQKIQIYSAKLPTLATELKFREISFLQYRKNFLFFWNELSHLMFWRKITKYFITTSYDIFDILLEFSFQTNKQKYKKINQNLFIFFINRQGSSKSLKKKINLGYSGNHQTNKENFRNSIFTQDFVKNLSSNWIRQKFRVKPRILHWKNFPIYQYIFVMNFLEEKFKTQILSRQSKHYFSKFQKQKNSLKIGNNVYIRILLCFKKDRLNQKTLMNKYSKKFVFLKRIIKNQSFLPQKNKNKRTYFSSNNLQEKWCFFGQKSKNHFSTYLKNFFKKKKSLYLKKNIFILEEILPHSISQKSSINVNLTKIQRKTINSYLNIYCFFLKNFSFIKNFKIRFLNKKPHKPIQKFVNFRENIQNKYSLKVSMQRNKNIHNLIQTNKYNEKKESISKKSLIFRKIKIFRNFREYKIRYLKSLIPKKKQYSELFKKDFNKTFFIFFSSLKYSTFRLKNQNYLYSVNKKQKKKNLRLGPAIGFSKNLRFSVFNKIKTLLPNNYKYLKKIKPLKKNPFLNTKFQKLKNRDLKLQLVNILPLSFHLKLFLHHSPKFQLLSEKSISLFSKIKDINLKIVQKNFSYSFETQIFIRFFLFFSNSEILRPFSITKKYTNNILFTNTENYFSQRVLSTIQNNSNFNQKQKNKIVFRIDIIQNKNKLCLCLLGNMFPEKIPKIPGSLFPADKLINDEFTFQGGLLIAKTSNTLLFRKAINYLLNDRSIFYAHQNEIISKNQHLCSVFYNQLKSGDIVQGIPKIEEIFEARKKSIYKILSKKFYKIEIDEYLENLQTSVLNNIQRIYCGQGIYISDKHIEIIVRQMTSNVVISDPGRTGLLCGEIIALKWVQKLNSKPLSNKIIYEPILLGMTKTCLQTSSFLSAASFQETTRVLARAAIQNKIDFLQGLKQNVILGKVLPIGTGYFE
uniref:DNA-directed RNA polymerase n=1 Tax=Chlorodesmis fastigiata TaxID=189431 RepID=A0A2P0QHB4_CHLFS|nr:RNA polymerase b-subunit [Chlorodesmis fastigiata]ARO74156.1 RNA polymerase b-subunit [Chlorodesmis fastigiata]